MNSRLMPDNARAARRAKIALALTCALAVLLVSLGIAGMRAFDRSGFDEARGFSLVHQAGRYAREGLGADQAMIGALDAGEQLALDRVTDDVVSGLWRRVRYMGESLPDFARADDARRREFMDTLLRDTEDQKLRDEVGRAADLLGAAADGVAQDGEPAYKWIIRGIAQGLANRQTDALLADLAALEREQAGEVALEARIKEQSLFEEAVGEKRLSRYKDGGAGMVSVALALFGELLQADPQADLDGLFTMLREVPRDAEPLSHLFAASPKDAFPAVLNVLDFGNISGARLLALARELYAALKASHPDITSLDHNGLISLQVEAMADEEAERLRAGAERLLAQAWNARLAPLLLKTLEAAASEAPADSGLPFKVLSRFAQGEPAGALQEELAGMLMEARDAQTSAGITAYLQGVPASDAFQVKARMIAALFVFEQPSIPLAQQRALAGLAPQERADFRSALLDALTDPLAPLPSLALEAAEASGTGRDEAVLYLLLLSGRGWGKLYDGDVGTGLRLAMRANAPRVRAAQMIAEGGGGYVTQTLNSMGKQLTLAGVLLFVDVLLLAFLMRSGRDWRFDVKWLLILMIVDFMLVFQILPLGFLLFRAITPQGSFSLETFGRLFSYNMNRSALVNTVVGGLAAMVLGTLIAFPLAWLVGRTNLHGRRFFRRLFVLTYMVPPYVGAMAWLRLLNPNVGTVNLALRGLLGLSAATGPINVYSLGGLVWVLTTFYYPYAFITISRAMEKMDPSLEEASRVSGASPFITLARVTLPIMTPSLIAGALLVFVSAASCYGIPSIIGAPGKVHTVTTRIIEYYGRGTQGLNDATGLAVFLMALAILILYLSDFVIAKKQYITVSGKSVRPNIVDLRAWRVPLTVLVSLFAGLIVLLPFATILTTSLKIDVGKSVLEAGNFTLNQWSTVFSRSETMGSLRNSLVFASVAATAGIAVAMTMSYLLQRTRIPGRRLPDFLITLGSGSPSVVIALGLIMSMQGRFGVNIYNTAWILIVAYLIKYMMMGMRTVTSAISQIHVSLEESSQIAGASWVGTMRRVTGPLIFPSIAAGWFLIFIPCFYELSMTTLLYSNTTKTIGFQLYEYWTYTSQPQASAMAFGILMIVIVINTLFNRLTKGEFSI